MGKIFGIGPLHKPQFLNNLFSHIQNKKTLSLDASEFHTYVSMLDVCKATGIVLDTPIEMTDTYHLGSPTPYSEYDFAKEVVMHWGLTNNFLKPVAGKKGDKNFTLDCGYFTKTFQFQFTPIDVSLLVLKQNLQHGFY
jgi:dTDP-4-dehydrorhamnose reductase